jgi:NADH-quinone oxidoreductase subunit N
MWGDFDLLGPVLSLAGVATLIIIWDILPTGRLLPRPQGVPLLVFGLVGPALASMWAVSLLVRDERGFIFHGAVVIDDFSYFFIFFFAAIAATIILASQDYAKRFGQYESEYVAIVLLATAAMTLLASSRDLILIFICLETAAISQYILAALNKDDRSTEAGMKYLLLGATSSAVILFGMSYLFGLTGTTRLVAPPGELSIATAIADGGEGIRGGLVLAVVFLITGLGFKMAVVPFQMWVPDVYEGSPAPVAAFLSVASKGAAFAVVLRIFFEGLPSEIIRSDWADIFAIVAAISMTVGNVLALQQSNIKRLLGYSSIAQAGYLMVGLAAVSAAGGLSLGASGVIFFLAAYVFTNLGAFIVVIAISDRTGSDLISTYAGLARRAPLLAAALAFAMISLTGIPPTAGFVAKLYIFNAAVQSDLIWLVVIAVLNSVISAFYYIKVAGTMYLGEPPSVEAIATSPAVKLALAAAVVGIVFVGVAPAPLLDAAKSAAEVFGGGPGAVLGTR